MYITGQTLPFYLYKTIILRNIRMKKILWIFSYLSDYTKLFQVLKRTISMSDLELLYTGPCLLIRLSLLKIASNKINIAIIDYIGLCLEKWFS